ncbi:MTH1187 family thiamine-binding protein [Chloroflexota bacterium]
MALAEVSIIPLGTDTTSLSKFVAQVVKVLQAEPGIKYELTAMGTIIEGDLGQLFSIIQKMHETVFDDEVKRVLTVIKIDDRRDKAATMTGKVKSVKTKLGH